MVSPTEKCGAVRTDSLRGRLTGRLFGVLSGILSIKPFAMLSMVLDRLSVELVGSDAFSGVADPRVSEKTPPIGSCIDALSIARGGGVASSCLDMAM